MKTMKALFLFLNLTFISFSQTVHQMEYQFHPKFDQNVKNNSESFFNTNVKKSKSFSTLNKTVFGFLPWWEYTEGSHQHLRFDLLSHIALFSFEADSDGNLNNPPEWPWDDLISTAHSHGLKIIMTVTNFDGNDIHKILNEPEIAERLFQNILNSIVQHNLDGVNIDFENLLEQDTNSVLGKFLNSLRNYISIINKPLEVSFSSPSFGFWEMGFQMVVR